MNFAYTGKIRLNTDLVFPLYLLAQNLGCRRLKSYCVSFIRDKYVTSEPHFNGGFLFFYY